MNPSLPYLTLNKLIQVVLEQGKNWDHKRRSNSCAVYRQRVSSPGIHWCRCWCRRTLLGRNRCSQDDQDQHLDEEEGPGHADLCHCWESYEVFGGEALSWMWVFVFLCVLGFWVVRVGEWGVGFIKGIEGRVEPTETTFKWMATAINSAGLL